MSGVAGLLSGLAAGLSAGGVGSAGGPGLLDILGLSKQKPSALTSGGTGMRGVLSGARPDAGMAGAPGGGQQVSRVVSADGLPKDVRSMADAAESQYGLPSGYMARMAQIESGGNPQAYNKSGAKGLYQFVPSTAEQYGLTDPFDPQMSTDAAARLALDNQKALSKALGRDPSAGELYLAHQQGGGGASALLANPGGNVVDVLTGIYNGNRGRALAAVKQNGGSADMSAGEFAKRWTGKFDAQPDSQRFSNVRRAMSTVKGA